ncbi:MAG: NADH-quinone oxidoreductase subunit H [Lachnospiraceae bacterium]|nr:NADH-quinone oxidoreductase subunit H [Lachnospiraceae bacterium]
MYRVISVIAYLVLAPFIGGLLSGIDRKISARMQGRIGPSVFQPFYDVIKLFSKQFIVVNTGQTFLILSYFLTLVFTGCLFFAGNDILLCFFILSTGATFLIFAACLTNSPYSNLGASRELVQMMCYEPAVILACVGFYLATGSFNVSDIIQAESSAILKTPGFFLAFVFILTIKMRKSPFDLSASHHPHQEMVKGVTTDMGSKTLGIFEVAEWYENVFLMGMVALFIVNKYAWSYPLAILVVLLVYFIEILIDNTSARVKWHLMFKITWFVTLLLAGANLIVLMIAR